MRLQRSMTFLGRSKIAYTLTKPLYPRVGASSLGPHVWRARSSDSNQKEVIVKFCKPDTTQSRSDFQKEILQSQKFKEARYIRKILDVIEDDPNRKGTDTNNCEGMVLESFPETLWEARENGRLSSFGLAGIRKIMKDALLGIQELHAEGVIHLDIKAQNILLDRTSARLSDLGSAWPASPPSIGTAQPMPYRSPEILFGLQWSKEVDIWGWGMVYLHMIQAYHRPDIWGLYDRFPDETGPDMTQTYEDRVRCDIFHDFRLSLVPYYQQCKDRWPRLDPGRREVTIRSILGYFGFQEEDILLLERVLAPDPRLRPTAKEIVNNGWLEGWMDGKGM